MSYNIELVDAITRERIMLNEPHHMCGGTYVLGGCLDARLNVTYNYARHYDRVFPPLAKPRDLAPEYLRDGSTLSKGIRTLYGLTGAESLPLLDSAIAQLGDDVDDDYWQPTEGNAKRALTQLRALAHMRPDGLWTGD